MTDAALIIDTGDTALLSGSAMPSASVNSPDASGKGGFAGVLNERIQGEQTRQSQANAEARTETTSSTHRVAGQQGTNGVVEPVRGKPLPSEASNSTAAAVNPEMANSAQVVSLAVLAQQATANLIGANIAGVAGGAGAERVDSVKVLPSNLPVTSAVSMSLPLTGGGVANIASAKPGMSAEGGATQPISTALVQNPLLAVDTAKQFKEGKSSGAPLDSQNMPKGQNSQAHSSVGNLSLLGQVVAEPTQRALNNALQMAGLGQRAATTSPVNALRPQGQPIRSTGLNASSNGLTAAMAVLETSGITASTARADIHLSLRMDTLLSKSLKPSSPVPVTSALGDSSSLLSGIPRITGAVTASPTPTFQLPTQVGQPGWANELGQRVTWLAQNDLREAKLQLNPRNLGPVEVRISYGLDQQLNVSFTASNPAAREALDAALPRLREMFEQQGLNLADAKTSHESFTRQREQNGEQGEPQSPLGQWQGDTDHPSGQPVPINSVLMGEGMIDAYA
ncbi:MAG: flagellar hook-length control protein FliK [Ectothiorhodospiraceae bacterium]|nr:flagellar hook-length control protein FliK [Ectothiorhodospiraceae bacterium]